MIAGIVKYYGVTFKYVLDRMTIADVIMYSAVIPDYREKKEETGKKMDFDSFKDLLRGKQNIHHTP